ncbi:DUF885 domain-containing protein [Teredinibacter purpureus]|uniref:DUF885 domain-containing protein n=1 Tax=Teredinibacter purpureus TaxID=2731756 RepID=UPI0005F8318E|nr:DUF885 domain-containing protein [Teredinibacter purpureus]
MIRLLLVAALFVMALGCSKQASENPPVSMGTDLSESEKLNNWFEGQYSEKLEFSPIELTFQGRKELYDKIDDFSLSAEREKIAWMLASVSEMKNKFDYAQLTSEAKTSYDLWIYSYEMAKAGEPYAEHGYIFNQMNGLHSFLPTFLISFHKVESEEDMIAYNARIEGVARGLGQLLDRAIAATKKQVRPPRFSYEIVITEIEKLISGRPFDNSESDSPLWADAKKKVAELVEKQAVEQSVADILLEHAREALLEKFEPVNRDIIAFLVADLQNTSERSSGVHALPNGLAYYNYCLQLMTTTALTAEEIHALGLKEVERLRADILAVKEQSGFDGDLSEFFAMIRDSKGDERFYYPDTDEGRQGYLDDATQAIDNIKVSLPQYFGMLPEADLDVRRVEAFREQDGAAQHYFPGTPDGSRPGIYYAHLSDMTAMPKNKLEVVAYHEGLPGHHMQISIAQELDSIPTFRRQEHFTAYVEGWALYSEYMAKEIPGTYADVYAEFGRLNSEIWRAIRLVVDTGLHAKGWSEQQAIDYFLENTPAPVEGVRSEVRRYLVMPGQATSYKIGMLDIIRLRTLSEQQLGEGFDIRGFHDTILGGGALPLPLLQRRVDQWLEAGLSTH